MKQVWSQILGALQGKKTYLLVVLLFLITAGCIATGKLTVETACTIFLVFLGLFAASFRSAIGNHQDDVKAELAATATLMRDVVAHNTRAAVADGLAVFTKGEMLATEIQAEQAAEQKAGTAQ